MTDPIYRASPGAHLSDKDAMILGPAWEKLEKRLKRSPTPDDLVEEARKSSSPFHRFFEWDPEKQRILYLRNRAYYIIKSLDVILPDHGDIPVRAIVPTYDGDGSFISTRRADATRPDVIQAQLDRAKADAKAVVERHQGWIGFQGFQPARTFLEAARDLAYES